MQCGLLMRQSLKVTIGITALHPHAKSPLCRYDNTGYLICQLLYHLVQNLSPWKPGANRKASGVRSSGPNRLTAVSLWGEGGPNHLHAKRLSEVKCHW